jgi:diguanylate cyclase (GGDEF)-like protein/PAS domain S-box-containing protein
METEVKPIDRLGDESRELQGRSAESEASQTEPQQTDEALENESDFLFMSALFDRSSVLMVILDHQGRVRGFSRACEQATGYTFEDVWGKRLWDLLLIPEEIGLVKAVFEKLRAGQFPIDYESHWVTKYGGRRLIAWSNTALLDNEGTLDYVIATGVDVTGRRRAEEALRISEERYRRLVESSSDAILVHYRGKIVFANKAGVALLGASSPDQVIGKPVMSFVHPDNRDVVRERLEKILEEETELPLIEDKLIRLDNTVVHVAADSIFPFMYEDQPAVQVVAREMTEGKQAKEGLHQAEERYRQLFEANIAGIYHATSDGRLLDCNKSFAELLGYESPEEVLGLRGSELYQDPADHEALIRRLQIQGAVTNFELILRRKDGSPLRVLENAWLIDSEDGASSVVQGTLVEITERMGAEEARWTAEKMCEVLVEISTDALTVTDLRGRITNVSQRTLELYGLESAQELIGRSAFELIASEDHEKAIANLQEAMKEGVVRNVGYALLRQDGTRFPGELHTALIRDALDKPKYFIFAARELRHRELAWDTRWTPAEESRPKEAEASALLEASLAVLEQREFEQAARTVFDSCKTLIGADEGCIALLKEDGVHDEVLLSDSDGFSWMVEPTQRTPLRDLRAQACNTGKAAYRNELSRGEGAQPAPGGRPSLDNILFAPLVIGAKAVGLLGFANKPGGFTENDARIASAFGQLAAVALHSNQTVEALEASEARFRSVSETADHAIITFDTHESMVSWNRGAETIFGYSAHEAVGRRFALPMSEELEKGYEMAISQLSSADGFAIIADRVEMVGRRKDGNEFPLELSLVAWKAREDIFLTSSIRDITRRRLAEDAVRLLADHDPLTGLPNRALFTDCLTETLATLERTEQQLAILMLDLDSFMDINHTLGHKVGDRLLEGVGDRLSRLVRAGDMVARSGGDEFMLLFPGIAVVEHAAKIAGKVLLCFQNPFMLDGHEIQVTASIGIAIYPDDGEDVDTLIRNAELAMCRVKEEGGNDFRRSAPTTDTRGPRGVVQVT